MGSSCGSRLEKIQFQIGEPPRRHHDIDQFGKQVAGVFSGVVIDEVVAAPVAARWGQFPYRVAKQHVAVLLESLGARHHDEGRQPQPGTQPLSLGGAGEIRHSLRKSVVCLPVPDGPFPAVVNLDGVKSEAGELHHDLV